MEKLTRWVLRHKLIVVLFWVIVTVIGFAAAPGLSGVLSKDFSLPGSSGYEANQALLQQYGNGGISPPLVAVVKLPEGQSATAPVAEAQMAAALTAVQKSAPDIRVAGYPGTRDKRFVSADGRTTFAYIYAPVVPGFDLKPTAYPQITAALNSHMVAGQPIQLTGIALLSGDGGSSNGPSLLTEVLLGGVGALIVLAFVFASFLAVVPLLMAVVAIPSTLLIVNGLARITDVSFIVQFLVSLIGLGVAIDYSLLVVTRWREERALGAQGDEAIVKTMKTAGRAVLVSGAAVAVGLVALVVIPVPFLRSIGYGGLLIPVVSVLVALTLLPVILAKWGPRLEWPRLRKEETASRSWTAWARMIVRHRWIAAGVGIAILGLLLVPAVNIVVGQPSATSLANPGPAATALNDLHTAGIDDGALTPMEVLATPATAASTAKSLGAVKGVLTAVAPGATNPTWSNGTTSIVEVIPEADGATAAGRDAINAVRDTAATLPGAPKVGGIGPQNSDFISSVYGSFPLMILLIAIVTFIFLAREFRSLLLPLKAVLLNILSVAAAWGIMVWVWQEGNLSETIWNTPATGAIDAWIPLMVFAFLYGLSMDYEVFILSRMREEYDATGSTPQSITVGIGRTGRLVTSAALILFLAFIALGATPETTVRIFATGLAAGILLDATVVRALLVPALVSLFGRWNWWLPTWAAKILRVEPSLPPPGSD